MVANMPSVELQPQFRLNGQPFPGAAAGVAVFTLWARPASLFIRKIATEAAALLSGGAEERFERLLTLLNAAVDKAEKSDREPFR